MLSLQQDLVFESFEINSDEQLSVFHQANCSAVLWKRNIDAEIQKFALDLLKHMPKSINYQGQIMLQEIQQLLAPWQSLWPQGFEALCQDIMQLATFYQRANTVQTLEIQLQRITTDLCTRFHADHNHARLLCSYLGAGTIWTDDDNVIWDKSSGEYRISALKDPQAIQQTESFDVLMMKGRRHPQLQGRGQVHRSPEANAHEGIRLLLKIEAVKA